MRKCSKIGDIAMLELAVVVEGFWADYTRTYIVGEGSQKQRKIIKLIEEIKKTIEKKVYAGMKSYEVFLMCQKMIKNMGFGRYFKQSCVGHGIGFSYHEPIPYLSYDNKTILQPGMVFTIEPGVYINEFGGVRSEDNVCLTTDKVNIL